MIRSASKIHHLSANFAPYAGITMWRFCDRHEPALWLHHDCHISACVDYRASRVYTMNYPCDKCKSRRSVAVSE